jgi:hypothetical protein
MAPQNHQRPTVFLVIQGAGIAIFLSRSFVGGALPFILALEVAWLDDHSTPFGLLGRLPL